MNEFIKGMRKDAEQERGRTRIPVINVNGKSAGEEEGNFYRSRSGSKRSFAEMDEESRNEWTEVVKRKPRPINYGKAKIDPAHSDEIVAPFEIFIANTHPESTAEIVKKVLIDCSSADKSRSKGLDILDIQCMTNLERFPYPRTLCWKVIVPQRERDYMMKEESYPQGWAHRIFFPPRQAIPSLIPPAAKQSRMDDWGA